MSGLLLFRFVLFYVGDLGVFFCLILCHLFWLGDGWICVM